MPPKSVVKVQPKGLPAENRSLPAKEAALFKQVRSPLAFGSELRGHL